MEQEEEEEVLWRLAQRNYNFGITRRNPEMEVLLQGGGGERSDGYLNENEAASLAAFTRHVILKGLECMERERNQVPNSNAFAEFGRARKRQERERSKPGYSVSRNGTN